MDQRYEHETRGYLQYVLPCYHEIDATPSHYDTHKNTEREQKDKNTIWKEKEKESIQKCHLALPGIRMLTCKDHSGEIIILPNECSIKIFWCKANQTARDIFP